MQISNFRVRKLIKDILIIILPMFFVSLYSALYLRGFSLVTYFGLWTIQSLLWDCYAQNCVSPNPYIETTLGDRSFKDVIKVK